MLLPQVDEENLRLMLDVVQKRQKILVSQINSMTQTVSSMIVEDPQLFAFCEQDSSAKRFIPYVVLFILMLLQVLLQYIFLDRSYRAYWPKWL